MAMKKVTITIPEETHAKAVALAKSSGLPFSTWLAQTAEHEVRVQQGLEAVREWEEENGAFTDAEVAWAESQLANADATTKDKKERSDGVA
jgi:hypothetical protein